MPPIIQVMIRIPALAKPANPADIFVDCIKTEEITLILERVLKRFKRVVQLFKGRERPLTNKDIGINQRYFFKPGTLNDVTKKSPEKNIIITDIIVVIRTKIKEAPNKLAASSSVLGNIIACSYWRHATIPTIPVIEIKSALIPNSSGENSLVTIGEARIPKPWAKTLPTANFKILPRKPDDLFDNKTPATTNNQRIVHINCLTNRIT